MAAPAYGTDLQTVSLCEATTGWSEMTGRTSGGAATQEDRAYIQQSYCVSQSTGAATGATVGLQFDFGSNISWTTGFIASVWLYWQAPKAIATWANGGIRFGIGSAAGAVKLWNAVGSDYGRNPYGGFSNIAVDPTYTADETIGSPGAGAYRIFCSAPNLLQAVSKGNPHCVDALRYGRAKLEVTLGDVANGYGTFAGMATANDADSARWGIFQYQFGSYLFKGLLSFGTDATAVDFRDENRVIFIDDTPRTYADFNRLEVRHASSRVDWTSVSFAPLGTLSKGRFQMHANADVNIAKCTFTDMDSFIFQSNATVDDSTWRRCGLVTNAGAAFNRCLFDKASGTIAVTTTELDKLNACSFISDGTGHAVELTSISDGEMVWNCPATGYAASDGSSGNEVIYINCTSSANLAITVAGSASTPTIRKAAGYTGTVSFPTSVTLTMIVKDENNQFVNGAFAYIDNNDQSPFILNTTTGADGVASTSYAGSTVNGSRWRVRKYGYKQFKQLVDISTSNITVYVTLAIDPQQV